MSEPMEYKCAKCGHVNQWWIWYEFYSCSKCHEPSPEKDAPWNRPDWRAKMASMETKQLPPVVIGRLDDAVESYRDSGDEQK